MAQAWEDLGDISGNAAYRHDDVYFITPSLGYTLYYNSNVNIRKGTIYKTTDAGQTWNENFSSLGTHFRCITFMDAQTGIAGNLGKGSFDNTYDTIPLYRTTNGGLTWEGTNPFPQTLKGLCALTRLNENTIYGVGRVRGPAHLITSTNKGETWNLKDLKSAGLGAAMDLYFSHPDTGFVVGMDTNQYQTGNSASYKGKVIYTTNGGLSWTTVIEESLNPTYFWKISFPSRNVGYVSLQQNTMSYPTVVYYKTTNGGQNWVRNEIPTSLFGSPVNFLAQGIGFISENRGWIGGGGFAINMFETTNGGDSWSNISSTYSFRINKFRFFGDYAYSSGIKVHRWIRSPLQVENEESSKKEVLVFPNPVQNELHIALDQNIWNAGKISVFNLSGEEIQNQEIQNENKVTVGSLKRGIYFLKVTSGEKIWFSRFIKE